MSRPEHLDLGTYHILVEGARVWAFRMEAEARHILEMTPKARLAIPHVDLVFESAASELAGRARFLEPGKRRQLERLRSVGDWIAVQHVIEVLIGRPVTLVDGRPPIALRPRDRPDPYVPPRPLDPGEPTKPRDVFAYEVRLVDELGEPIEGVLMLVADSSPLKTDADGRAHYDYGSSSSALARFLDPGLVRDALLPRWEQARAGDWLTETGDHTYVDCTDALPMVPVRADRLHTIVVQPRVICARMLDLLFDTNKSFLLPSALEHIRDIRKLYDTRPRAQVLIVGHTDTTGEPEVNDPLSLDRAKAVKAYLRDDVETWLDFYGDHMRPKARWGSHEDHLMLQAVLAESGEELTDTPVRHYQATRDLEPDNKLGPKTRRAIVTEYMAVDGTTLPEGIDPIAHGCGENFPLEKEDVQDLESAHAHDRRVELFFFDASLGVLPRPTGELSKPGSEEYLEWRARSVETHNFIAPQRGLSEVNLRLHDDARNPMPGAPFIATIGKRVLTEGLSDDEGFAFVPLPPLCPERIRVRWGEHSILGYEYELDVFPDCFPNDAGASNVARLHNLGYAPTIDLEAAVRQFQADYAVDADPEPVGLVDGDFPAATQSRLDAIWAEKNANATTP